jgi:hypothetical protein
MRKIEINETKLIMEINEKFDRSVIEDITIHYFDNGGEDGFMVGISTIFGETYSSNFYWEDLRDEKNLMKEIFWDLFDTLLSVFAFLERDSV